MAFPPSVAHLVPRPTLFYKVLAFTFTFISFAMVHATRKSIASATPLLKDPDFGYTTAFFGIMNIVFMLTYAIGMVFTGILGDIYNPLVVLLCAAILIASVQCTFAVLVVFFTAPGLHYLYYVMNACNGISQSIVWPVLVKVMSSYFGAAHSGIIFSLWTSSTAVGNIIGASLASLMIFFLGDNKGMVIVMTLITPALMLVIMSILTFVCLPETLDKALCSRVAAADKSNTGFVEKDVTVKGYDEEEQGDSRQPNQQRINIWRVWLIPGVFIYALAYACIEGSQYAIFFWLPLYLNEHTHLPPEQANFIDTIYNVGVVVGSLACGWLSDMTAVIADSGRAPYLFLFQVLSLIPVSLLHVEEPSIAYLYVTLSLAGFFIGGVANVVSSAVCTDLGRRDALKGNRDAVSQIAGIIEGIGACGAAIQQGLVLWIATYSWGGVFILLPVAIGISCVLMASLAYRETKAYIIGRLGRQ
ncbi:hypothetical protein FOL47_005671 [Perkinsus chesapeaki]|uniref:Major facilitator superfamily (MFS) profile domain-containing protein n=1 Tax=Perkinsus chesapeaki TaxID=330153 RepID=A0A7J6LWE5_PERCH|nr:hypothetical protein FOL47_005671 [Perkinsus chesapeaki]